VGAALLGAALLLACNSAAQHAPAPQSVPVPAPDTFPTLLLERHDSVPPLDYILVAFEDSVSAASRARILADFGGVVEGGIDMGAGLPGTYIVRIPPAEDYLVLERLINRLRRLAQVFAAGMVQTGMSGV
jgi:hypothetical protein